VRELKEIGPGVDGDGEFLMRMPADETKGAPGPLRLIVFLTDKHSGRVLGVQEQAIAR
jgi:hypothetical protein